MVKLRISPIDSIDLEADRRALAFGRLHDRQSVHRVSRTPISLAEHEREEKTRLSCRFNGGTVPILGKSGLGNPPVPGSAGLRHQHPFGNARSEGASLSLGNPPAPANFVLEVSSTGIAAKKFSIGAQLVYIGILVAGLFGGLGLSTLLIALLGLRSETTPFLVSLGVILLIPFGMIPGDFIGRGVLRMWPRSESVDVQISSVRLGTFWEVLDLVSPRGPLTVRVVSWRKQLEKVLRRNNQMPPTDRVSLEGFRT